MAAHPSLADQIPVIVTDATCDLPPDCFAHFGIGVIPFRIAMGDYSVLSGADLSVPDLIATMAQHDNPPTVSALAASEIRDVFERIGEGGRPILAILVSSRMSETFAHALAAARNLNETAVVTIVDSRTIGGELGLQVLTAARAAHANRTVADILPLLRKTYVHSTLQLCLDDLTFLEHSEQMRLVSYRVAKTLGLKPVITVGKHDDSAGLYIASNERPRSLKDALDAFERNIAHAVGPRDPLRVLIAYGDARSAALADTLAGRVQTRFIHAQIEIFPASAATVALNGPRVLSVSFIAGDWPI